MILFRRGFVSVVAIALVAAGCGSKSPSQPTPNPPSPNPPSPPTLTAPVHFSPLDDAQTSSLQPSLEVTNATSTPEGTRTYEFQVSLASDFGSTVVGAQNIAEGANGRTIWVVSQPLLPTTRYWWRARAVQSSTNGPWSTPARLRSRVVGYSRPGELYDPLTNEATVGDRIGGTTFLAARGIRLDSLGSRVAYTLPQTLMAGEFSLYATGLDPDTVGDSTKLFSMMQGSADIRQNPYRATIEKRDHGIVTFRFIAGNLDDFADGPREEFRFNPSVIYFWKFTWGNGVARLLVVEGGENGRVMYDRSAGYSGTYRPSPHIAHLGAPPPASVGNDAASVPGAIIRDVWISSNPRPPGLISTLEER